MYEVNWVPSSTHPAEDDWPDDAGNQGYGKNDKPETPTHREDGY